jgi:hypothetical protein
MKWGGIKECHSNDLYVQVVKGVNGLLCKIIHSKFSLKFYSNNTIYFNLMLDRAGKTSFEES